LSGDVREQFEHPTFATHDVYVTEFLEQFDHRPVLLKHEGAEVLDAFLASPCGQLGEPVASRAASASWVWWFTSVR
jgi:hypothetical protein